MSLWQWAVNLEVCRRKRCCGEFSQLAGEKCEKLYFPGSCRSACSDLREGVARGDEEEERHHVNQQTCCCDLYFMREENWLLCLINWYLGHIKEEYFLFVWLPSPGLFTHNVILLCNSQGRQDVTLLKTIVTQHKQDAWRFTRWNKQRLGTLCTSTPSHKPPHSYPVTLPSWAGSGSGVREISLSSRRQSHSPSTDTRKLQR